MATAYFMIGVQGSGKSTWVRENAQRLNAVVIASDEIRNELEAQGIDATNKGDLVFWTVEERLGNLLAEDKNVIVDATHARRAWREKEIAIARQHGAKVVAVWLDVPLDVSLERNQQKPGNSRWGERVVPKEVLLGVARGFEKPTVGEFDEVWRLTDQVDKNSSGVITTKSGTREK
jgi:predicted kinase